MSEEKPLLIAEFAETITRGHRLGLRADVFWSHVEFRPGDCWIWNGTISPAGYGTFKINGRGHSAHRLTYILSRGEIPQGHELDHLCRTRECVNPLHLEAVTHRENCYRGISRSAQEAAQITCRQGHDFSGVDRRGKRICRVCANAYMRRRHREGYRSPSYFRSKGLALPVERGLKLSASGKLDSAAQRAEEGK